MISIFSRRAFSPWWLALRADHAPQARRLNDAGRDLPHNARRRGYTLLELMLVLGILLILAGIAWPAVQGMYQRHRLQTAAEDVRAHLAGTRLRAIDSDTVYQFVYEPGGQAYSVQPYEASALPTTSAMLPEPIRFDATDALNDSTDFLLNQSSSAGAGTTNLSTPILFAPDGSSIDATVSLVDDEGRTIRLSVRGLTAAVSVGSVQQRASQ